MQQERISRLIKELDFKAVRSSGPGGQNVNKVSTKIELRFNIDQSAELTEVEKAKIKSKLDYQLTNQNELLVFDQSSRSQLTNKDNAIYKFITLITQALKPEKKRVPTKPTIASKLTRLENKKKLSEKKINRNWDQRNN